MDSPLSSLSSLSFIPSPPESISMSQDTKSPAGHHTFEPPRNDNRLSGGPDQQQMVSESITVKNPKDGTTAVDTKPTPATVRGEKRKAPVTPTSRATGKNNKRAKAGMKKWQSPFVYTDPKTPLAGSNLRAILLNSRAWDALDDEEQNEILELLPGHSQIVLPGSDRPRPDVGSLQSNDTFRSDSARYCESIVQGKHDPDWLHDAWVAHEMRNRGRFDDYQVTRVERDWDTEIPPEYRPGALREADKATSKDSRTSKDDTSSAGVSAAAGHAEAPQAPQGQPEKEPGTPGQPFGSTQPALGGAEELAKADVLVPPPGPPTTEGKPASG